MDAKYRLLLFALCLTSAAPRVYPHAGEDHAGESLSSSGGPMLGAPIRVPIETQIVTDIETTPVLHEHVPRSARYLGRTLIRPEYEAVITSPQEGRLIATDDYTPPSLGETVKKGQIIAVVEETIPATETINISTERARASSGLKQAETELQLAVADYTRASALKDSIAAKDIAHAKSALTVAQEKRDGLQKQLAILDTTATDTAISRDNAARRRVIAAPIDGIIARSHVTIGENVGRDKALYQIVNLSELLVEADVFENDLAVVNNAKSARVVVEAYPDESFPARLVSRGTSVDEQTRALHVLFAVANPDNKLVAGMFVHVFIETANMVDGLAIPKGAVVNQNGQSVVYVKVSAEQFVARPVVISEKHENMLILSAQDNPALKEGDRVVVQGMYQVRMSASMAPQLPPSPAGAPTHK